MLINNKSEIKRLNIDVYKGLFFAGFFLGMGYVIGLYGLKYSTSINYSFAIKSSIIFTPLLAILVLKEKIDKNRLFLIIAFIIGIYFIISGGKFILPRASDLLTLIAAFCFSCVVIVQKILTEKANSTIIAWGRTFFALPVFIILAFFMRANITKIVFPELVFTVGFLVAVMAISINKSINISTVTYVSMMSMIVSVLNVILGSVFLNETINFFQIFGGSLVIFSGIKVQKLNI
jgi:drug/metabolite transporter (DMT)-like permease